MARLQLDLSETHDEVITMLMEKCDLRTKKDVVENALILLGWAATEAQHGHIIAAVDEKRQVFKELQTPALMGAQRTGARKSNGKAAKAAAAVAI
jgi:hypothetical protein